MLKETYRPGEHTGSTHHNPNQMKKPTKSKHKGDSQYNTTQPTPDPTCTNPTPKKSTLPQGPVRHQQYYHTKSILQITNPPTNPHNPTTDPPQQQLTNELMTVQERSLFDQVHFQLLWSSGTPERLQSWYLCRSDRPFAVEHTRYRHQSRALYTKKIDSG